MVRGPNGNQRLTGKTSPCQIIGQTFELMAGQLPVRQKHLVEAWAELHQDELVVELDACASISGHPLDKQDKEYICTLESARALAT